MLRHQPRLFACLDSLVLPVSLPSSGPTRSEAAAVVSCGHASSHLGVRLGRCAVGVGARYVGTSSKVALASLQYVGSFFCPHLPQDLNSFSTSAFPHTGLTSAYPWHYPGPLLLEPSLPPMACGWLPAQVIPRTLGGLLRSVCPFFVTLGRYCTPCLTYRVDTTYLATTWPNGDNFPFGPASCPSADRHQPFRRF